MVFTKGHGATHGLSKTRTYIVWARLRSKSASGTKICARWAKFENFLKDMGPVPRDGVYWLTNRLRGAQYNKENCYWRKKRKLSHSTNPLKYIRRNAAKSTALRPLSHAGAAAAFGIKYQTYIARRQRGWGLRASLLNDAELIDCDYAHRLSEIKATFGIEDF